MKRNYSQPYGSQSFQRHYGFWTGVDFTSSPFNVAPNRSPWAVNVIADDDGVWRKRPSYNVWWSTLASNYDQVDTDGKKKYAIYGIFPYIPDPAASWSVSGYRYFFVHIGNRLYFFRQNPSNSYVFIMGYLDGVAAGTSTGFQHGKRFFFMDGKHFYCIFSDENEEPTFNETTPSNSDLQARYVYEIATAPETQIAGYWKATETTTIVNGEQEPTVEYEWVFGEKAERNLLTGRRINTFCGDGVNTVFYLDCRNFAVTKVEKYVPGEGGSDYGGHITLTATANIRSKPSTRDGAVLGTGQADDEFPLLGLNGGWYKIDYNGKVGYVYYSRATVTQGSSNVTDDKDWVELAESEYTVAEDSTKKCTKITFTSAPEAHPRGNGLPNIRVTGAATQLGVIYMTGAEVKSYAQPTYSTEGAIPVPRENMFTSISKIRVNNVEATSSQLVLKAETSNNGKNWIESNIPFPCRKIRFTTVNIADDATVKLTYRHESFEDVALIDGCYRMGKFGSYNTDRFFYTGNAAFRNRDWYSEPGDPTLVLENSYTDIGGIEKGIAGYLNTQGEQIIVKFDGPAGANLFRRTASSDGDLTIFPIKEYHGRGAVTARGMTVVKGEPLFLTDDGVFAFVSTDLGTRYAVQERSQTIKKKLLTEKLSDADFGVWGDYLFVTFFNGDCYVANTAKRTEDGGFEWYFWDHFAARNMCYDYKGNVIFNIYGVDGPDGEKVGRLAEITQNKLGYDNPGSDAGNRPFVAQWTTPCDVLDDPARYKHIEARGAIIHVDGSNATCDCTIGTDGARFVERIKRFHEDVEAAVDPDAREAAIDHPTYVVPINRRIPRFSFIQFSFIDGTAGSDMGVIDIEFQYRFGRYLH